MSTSPLNRSDQVISSSLGFGCGRIFGGRGIKQSAQLIEAALSVGIRHFDVAPSYGDGTAESALGDVLVGVNNVTITTKYGITAPKTSFISASLGGFYRRAIRPTLATRPALKQNLLQAVRSINNLQRKSVQPLEPRVIGIEELVIGIEQSLARLRRTRIDVLLIHEPDQFVLSHQLRLALDDQVTSGRIGSYGLGYGRVVDSAPLFGSVLQCKFDDISQQSVRAGTQLMLHGVIGGLQPKAGESMAALRARRIKHAINKCGASTVLFSASSVAQIREVADMFRTCSVD